MTKLGSFLPFAEEGTKACFGPKASAHAVCANVRFVFQASENPPVRLQPL